MKESFIRQRVEGAEVLKTVEKATVRRNTEGWQTTLSGSREDGSRARESFSTRVNKELAERDVPPGVEIDYVEDATSEDSRSSIQKDTAE